MREGKKAISRLFVGILLIAGCTGPPDPSTPTLAIRNTNVFDTHSGSFISGQTVLILGDRIVSVDPAEEVELSPATEVLDGEGKFLIPGLIDAHVHLTHVLYQAGITADEILPYFLANGVTTVRSTGDNVVAQSLLRRWADEHPGLIAAPVSRKLADRQRPAHSQGHRLEPHLARRRAGVRQPYVQMGRDDAQDLRQLPARGGPQSDRRGPQAGARRHRTSAQLSGRRRDCAWHRQPGHIESVSDFLRADPKDRHSLDLESDKAQQLVRTIADSGVFVDPTLSVFWGTLFFVDVDEVVNHPDNLKMPRPLQDFWAVDRKRRLAGYAASPLETRRATFRKYQDLVGMLHEAGARILVGTDAPEPQVPPGYSLHQEMEFLVESGMSPAAVLQAATRVNAAVLREENDLGSIEPGKRADLVLLRANPLEDIRNTRQIERVINRGTALLPSEILERRSSRTEP